MALREATTDDIEAIRRIVTASWETDYPAILSRESIEAGIDEWYAPERLREQFGMARTMLLVAEDAGTAVGFVHCLWDDAEGDILRLYVHPDHRGEGIGGALLEWAIDVLAEQRVDHIEAMVLEANDPGNEFYRAFGFEHVDTGETTIGGERYEENRYELTLD